MIASKLFADDQVDLDLLKQRAFNLRWATQPPDVIPLTAADPDFPVAAAIRRAIQEYADGGVLSYGPPEGLVDFRRAAARYLAEKHDADCSYRQILPTSGAAHAMFIAARYALEPGDEAIIFDPVDFLFRQSVDAAGGRVALSRVDRRTGAFDLDGLADLVTSRTRMICVCNPHNPLGRVMSREELEQIGELAVRYDLTIMADEIWSDVVFPPHRHLSLASLGPEIAERTLTVHGLSKGYGLAGLRIGFLVAPDPRAFDELLELSQMRTTAYGVTAVSQVAAQAAYERCGEWLEAFLEHLKRVRDYAARRLDAMPGIACGRPEGTYLLFPDITAFGRTSQEMADYLLREARVAVVPGAPQWFGPGAEGRLRICFSTSFGILREALDRIETALQRLT